MPGTTLSTDIWITEYMTEADVYAHGVTQILAALRTEWQDMQIVHSPSYGTALVLDGKWQSCTGDEFCYHEPLVQPAIIARAIATGKLPKTALILGGGEGATSREVLRWKSIERCAMVDIDGPVVDACKQHLAEMHRGAFDDPRHEVIIDDAFKVIDDENLRPEGGWDVIISDLSDPIEDGPSFRLFTKEYFQQLKGALAPGGVLSVQAGPVTPPRMAQHCRLNRTLRDVFTHAASVTGPTAAYGSSWGFVIASDEDIRCPADAAKIDELLESNCTPFPGEEPFGTTGLRVVDGNSLGGLFAIPRYLRKAIEAEPMVYTLADPPKFIGTGVANESQV